MATADGNIVIKIGANAESFKEGIRQVENRLEDFNNVIDS